MSIKTTAQLGSDSFPYIEDKYGKRHFFNSNEGDTLSNTLDAGDVIKDLLSQELIDPFFDMTLTKDEVIGLHKVLGPTTEKQKQKCGCTKEEGEAVYQFFKRIAQFNREIP